MKPVSFEYNRPQHFDEALEILASHGDEARLLAGGQSLIPMLNMRLARPSVLVDVGGLPDHGFIQQKNGMVRIGCCVTQRDLDDWAGLEVALPLVKKAIPLVGHFQTRNRGTITGSIAHADPSAEFPLCMAILRGQAVLASVRGERVLGAAELQTGVLKTACRPDEIIREVRFPQAMPGVKVSFVEEAPRHGDFAIVSVAVVADFSSVRIAFGGVSDRPIVHEWPVLVWSEIRTALFDFVADIEPYHDDHASADYRRHLMCSLGQQAILEVC